MKPQTPLPQTSPARPYVVVRCAMSLDACLDDLSPNRLILSNEEDFDRVDEVRAGCDALFVGAGTIRADNPRLLVRSERRQKDRVERGLPSQPAKVTWTRSGNLSPHCHFFGLGECDKFVYCPSNVTKPTRELLGGVATVIGIEAVAPCEAILADLSTRGVNRLLIEGGSGTITAFLSADLVDELHVSIAPFFVGQADAPRIVNPAPFPTTHMDPWLLQKVTALGHVVELRYNRR